MHSEMKLETNIRLVVNRQLEAMKNGRFAIRPPLHLVKQVAAVQEKFGRGHTDLVQAHRVAKAIKHLKSVGAKALRSNDRYVLAYTLAQPVEALQGRSLISDQSLFSPLLELWSRQGDRGALGPAVWRGLFKSYMQVAPNEGAMRIKLRTVLLGSVEHLSRARRVDPTWLQAAKRHLGLLKDDPCSPYVEELLSGNRMLLEDLIAGLAPPDASWFWDELVTSITRHIRQLTAESLVGSVSFLLALRKEGRFASKYRSDQILSSLIDRYAEVTNRQRHELLLAASLTGWNSPQLRTSVAWSNVTADAKKMVSTWLAEQDLEDFYRLCQGADQVDERRLRYWLRFKGQIQFSQIVLGRTIARSSDADIRDFRKRNVGRLARLDGGESGNNAILMQIGDWLFVEFSKTGNACYPYRVAKVPFSIGETSYVRTLLSNEAAVLASSANRLLHIDRNDGQWEQHFDRKLSSWDVKPDVAEFPRSRLMNTVVRPTEAPSRTSYERRRPKEISAELLDLLYAHKGTFEDNRANGGVLRISVIVPSDTLQRMLVSAGFIRKSTQVWYHA